MAVALVVLVAIVDTVSVDVSEVEFVVRKTVPEGVVTTTTLGGVIATCGGSEAGVEVGVIGVAPLSFSCCSWWFMA